MQPETLLAGDIAIQAVATSDEQRELTPTDGRWGGLSSDGLCRYNPPMAICDGPYNPMFYGTARD